ncbi:hypothetical protein CW711_02385 [Candidatus Bathyarchaeota archaeon]|nr:MAG: hypothetical protein B6U84_00445 [Candidatus Bathyarchaeota archaeon ex4484_40]RJS67706.1 MAG: hypothetical protein CW680_02180 [Candidatus Bathyarchaeota archaeon]RJS79607.1 MAG: hypothetical protein CW711_02385 [Candidatus Bathyarchaeota archaeon]RLG98688.1 MAG: hypothetical protein DRO29_00320 [Candidatus Bathyarchaeota archaeon]HDJ04429.1 hypothetical protein [Candidatus Bathyarchaeota archaeon]
MGKILDRILEKKEKMKSMDKYDENREKFKEVMGKPEIKISVELPEGYENRKKEFLELQKEEAFLKDVSKSIGRIVKKHLKKKKQ